MENKNHRMIHPIWALRICMIAFLLSGISVQLKANEDQRDTFFTLIESARGLQQHMPDFALVVAKGAFELSTEIGDDSLNMIAYSHQQYIEKKIKNRTLSLLLVSSFFLLFAITSFLIIINLRRKTEIERLRQVYITQKCQHMQKEKDEVTLELETKIRALAEKAMYLIKKNELISDISKQLNTLYQDMSEHCGPQLEQIIKSLKSDTDQQFWKEFQLSFIGVHQDFHQSLNRRFPDLSPAERKLSAFISLSLSSKEIAAITHKTPDGIKVARSRLRKKLGLTTEENLIAFLNNL